MRTTLVTGGAGFIGSHLTDELIERGHDVVVLDDLSGGMLNNIHPDAKFINGSVTDYNLVNTIFEQNSFEYVYHLAAYAAEGLSHFIKRFNYENNLIGSVNLINASVNHGIKCFIFTSSIAVYGTNQTPLREDMVPEPEDSYGIAKLAVEQELKISHEIFGLDYVIFRPHNVYGERQNIGDRYRNVIGIFMNQIMQGQPLSIFGDGSQTRAFTDVKDIVPIMAEAPLCPDAVNRVFNIGADEAYTIKELAEVVCKAMGVPCNIVHLEARNEVTHATADHTKLKQTFGYSTTRPLEVGVERMADWARSYGARRSKVFSNIEVCKNMPMSWRKELATVQTEEGVL